MMHSGSSVWRVEEGAKRAVMAETSGLLLVGKYIVWLVLILLSRKDL